MLEVVEGDITLLQVDVIVNAANELLLGGGGVDGAIHRVAGPELLAACRAIPEVRPQVRCPTGQARITPAFRLPARFVVHTVGPVWRGGAEGEVALLESCYRSSLELSLLHGARSVAFPAISTGAFGYPAYFASRTATRECSAFLREHRELERIVLVAFGESQADLLREAVDRVMRPKTQRGDWKTVELPDTRARLQVQRRYSMRELDWLKFGVLPREMEDKWFVFYEAPWLYVHRSWTGTCIYRARLEEDSRGASIAELWSNRDPAQYKQTDDVADARLALELLDGWAGHHLR